VYKVTHFWFKSKVYADNLRSNFILSIEDLRHSLLLIGTRSGMSLDIKWVPLRRKGHVHIIPNGLLMWLYHS